MKLEEIRPPTLQDRNRVLAEKLCAEAERLRAFGKTETSQKALQKYKEALLLWQALNDPSAEAQTLTRMGEVCRNLSRMREATSYFNQALPIWQAIRDQRGEAQTLNNLGWAYYGLGELQKALNYYTQALPIWQALGDPRGQAQALNTIGSLRTSLGDPSEAIAYHLQALVLARSAPDRPQEAYTLSTMALAYEQMADSRKALDSIAQALPIWQEVGNRYGEADAFNTAGMAYTDLGEYEKALDDFDQARRFWQEAGSQFGEAQTLNNTGITYYYLGEDQRAIDSYLKALKLWQAIGNLCEQATVLNNLGIMQRLTGNAQRSFDYFQKSLLINQANGNHSADANPLFNIGVYYLELGEYPKALQSFFQSLKLNVAKHDRSAEARNYLLIGNVYISLDEKQKARENYHQALQISREIRYRSLEASSLFNIALVEGDSGSLAQACASIEAAIEIIESLRGKAGSQDLQAVFFETKQNYYKLHVDLLMRLHAINPTKGFDAQALQMSERGRARNLLETLSEARVNISQGIDTALLERRTELQKQLNAKEQYRIRLLSKTHKEAQASAVEKELNELLMQFQEVGARLRSTSPKYAGLMQPQAATLQEIQQQALDKETLLLEYSLGKERSYLWVVTPTSISSFELGKGAELEAAATRVYDLLTARNKSLENESTEQKLLRVKKADQEFYKEAAALSQMILAPVASLLQNKRLLIVAEGALQYIPFAALPAPEVRKGVGERGRGGDRETFGFSY